MAVQLASSPQIRIARNYVSQGSPNLKLVSSNKFDESRAVASKIAFNAQMERTLLNNQYWNDLLEKLRKAGGGGGGGSQFDRVTVSMQLMSFLSDKTIQAMLKNFNSEFSKQTNNFLNQLQNTNQNVFQNIIQKIGNVILNGVTNIMSLIVRRDAPTVRLYTALTQLSSLIGIISFQLNKLKEILEEDLKELIRKLDVKGKIRKIKGALLDFFVGMNKELKDIIKLLNNFCNPRLQTFLNMNRRLHE